MKNLLAGLGLLAVAIGAGAAEPPLTEAEALRVTLARPAVADVNHGAIGLAEADAIDAGRIPNPTLDYRRDRTTGSSTKVEQTTQVSQSLDLSGRRGLRRDAAEHRVQAAQDAVAARRLDLVAELRRRFYEVLWRQATEQALEAWSQRMAQVETVVTRLERGGEVSGYDRRRLSRERTAAQARLESERAASERARAQLAAMLGDTKFFEEDRSVVGTLLPDAPPTLDTLDQQLLRRPDLTALEEQAAAAELDSKAAARGAIPDVTIGIGPKRVDDGMQHDSGIALSLSIPLPLFDRRQADGQRAAAQAMQARGEYALARARAEGDLRGLWKQTERLRSAAIELRAQTIDRSGDLNRIAAAAYQAGESTLLELLDAYRGSLEAETTALDVEWKARMSRIELDQLTGTPTP